MLFEAIYSIIQH